MGRLIEVQHAPDTRSPLAIQAGDVLLFSASGGHVRSGADVVELLGVFLTAVVGDNGAVLAPMGAPNTVLFRALRPGRATIEVVTGDPWHAPRSTTLEIAVAP